MYLKLKKTSSWCCKNKSAWQLKFSHNKHSHIPGIHGSWVYIKSRSSSSSLFRAIKKTTVHKTTISSILTKSLSNTYKCITYFSLTIKSSASNYHKNSTMNQTCHTQSARTLLLVPLLSSNCKIQREEVKTAYAPCSIMPVLLHSMHYLHYNLQRACGSSARKQGLI